MARRQPTAGGVGRAGSAGGQGAVDRRSGDVEDLPAIGARDAFTAFAPHATGGVYVNFAGFDDEADVSVSDTLGNEARLAELRDAYDPDGVFSGPAQRR